MEKKEGLCMRYLFLFFYIYLLGVNMARAEEMTNRLIHEKSPYLLQHVHNPVDWYPWGDEAFLKAKDEDKPIFLSIGYSTCHWCHVMEEESYSNPEIANILNQYFVAIKVDREERPDIDSVYMSAVQAMTGSGGWPLNIFLTADKKPFYGGTYFPPDHLQKVLLGIADAWRNRKDDILKSAKELTDTLNSIAAAPRRKEDIPDSIFTNTFEILFSQYDVVYGGFGMAPKFPSPHTLSFLLRYFYKTDNKKALEMVENTLNHIADGGIHDHLGGGFHRYSTDQTWFLPHFEKMLYDQAMLSRAYLEAYQITKKEKYAQVARDIFDYVLQDMASPRGGFYSAEDADSAPDITNPTKKKEGAYYAWTRQAIMGVLGKEAGEIFNYYYGVKEGGNVSNDPRNEFGKKNILAVAHTEEDAAKHFRKPLQAIQISLVSSKQKLFSARANRLRPHKDDKVLVDWNGLMISSLALGGRILHEQRYLDAAQKSADFVLAQMKTKDVKLLHRFRDNAAEIPGFLDDYAFFINGLLDLYEATFETRYLKEAIALADTMRLLFEDKVSGGFFLTGVDGETILSNRTKEYYDGAMPSGNSIAALVFLRLNRITLKKDFEIAVEHSLSLVSGNLLRTPTAHTQMLIALDYSRSPTKEIVVVAKDIKASTTESIVSLIYGFFLPHKILLFRRAGGGDDPMLSLAPWTENQDLIAGKTTIYVCENHVCKLPVTELEKLKKLLEVKYRGILNHECPNWTT